MIMFSPSLKRDPDAGLSNSSKCNISFFILYLGKGRTRMGKKTRSVFQAYYNGVSGSSFLREARTIQLTSTLEV